MPSLNWIGKEAVVNHYNVFMERAKIEQFKTITTENFEAASKHLGRITWEGNYNEALPLADKIFEFRRFRAVRHYPLFEGSPRRRAVFE